MKRFTKTMRRLLAGELGLPITFWLFDAGLWVILLLCLNFLSRAFFVPRVSGIFLGLLFVAFSLAGLVAVINATKQSQRRGASRLAVFLSFLLLLLSLYVPLYFSGKPLIVPSLPVW